MTPSNSNGGFFSGKFFSNLLTLTAMVVAALAFVRATDISTLKDRIVAIEARLSDQEGVIRKLMSESANAQARLDAFDRRHPGER